MRALRDHNHGIAHQPHWPTVVGGGVHLGDILGQWLRVLAGGEGTTKTIGMCSIVDVRISVGHRKSSTPNNYNNNENLP